MTLTRLRMECVKGRDLESVAGPLVIQGRPYIDKTGDFRVLSNDGIKASSDAGSHAPMERLKGAIQADRHVSLRNLSRTTGWSTNDVKKHAKTCGYQWTEQGWYQDSGEQLVPQEAEPSPVSYL